MRFIGHQIGSIGRVRLAIALAAVAVMIGLAVTAWRGSAAVGAEDAATPASGRLLDPVTIRFGVIEPPVVAQRDVTVRAPTSPSRPTPLPLEASGLAWIGDRLLISSDRHEHLIFQCRVNLDEMTIGEPEPIQLIRNEQYLLDDAESIAVRPSGPGQSLWTGYVLCSQSNDLDARALPHRRHLLTFRFNPNDPQLGPRDVTVTSATTIRDQIGAHLSNLHVPLYHVYNAEVDKNTYRWGNVEGMDFVPGDAAPSGTDAAPDGKGRLIIGMRNPLINDRAILAVFDPTAMSPRFEADQLDLFTLDLGGRGVAGLAWDRVSRGFLIVAALSNGPKLSPDQPYPPNTLDSALFWWSGRKSEAPILFARVPDMKIEAICRIGESPYIAIASDEGDVSEGRAQRQSMVTILHFTGVELAP